MNSGFPLTRLWSGWRKWVVWSLCLCAIAALGAIRHATDAEYAFASMALLPVLVLAWMGGRGPGLLLAALSALMWLATDLSSDRSFSASWVPWLNSAVRLLTYGLVVLLVSQVRLQFDREKEYATRDALTGLRNRREFYRAGTSEMARAGRYGKHIAVILLDLDNFKALNDTQGHDHGDMALKATAQALVAATRDSDLVARIGGDEFVVMLPEIGFDAAAAAGRKVFAAVTHALDAHPPTRASVGVAWFEVADRGFSDLLKTADELMYSVKANGKNDVAIQQFLAKTPRNDGWRD